MSYRKNSQEELERKVKDLLLSFNLDLRDEMAETPRRIVDLFNDMLEGCDIDIKQFFSKPLPTEHKEMIIIKDIEFVSWCCHHLWPFFGVVHIAYVPNRVIVGFSKFLSAVRALSRRPQLQEAMTSQLANTIVETLDPLGCMVIIEGIHTCMLIGGRYDYGMPAHTNARTVTSAVRGNFLMFEQPRQEALTLIYNQRR